MEFNISDLLDDLKEVELDIRPDTGASARRIKELTMKKIHKEEKTKRRGMSVLLKTALVAAVLISLAIPVMAATGFLFTDWLEGLGKENIEEEQVHYTSWEKTEGFWQVSLTAKDLTREGMTLVCREVQDSPVTGALKIHSGFRLERWNGEVFEYVGESAAGESREIKDLDCFEEAVNWADICGPLESGRYRLLKTFTYTFPDGTTAELTDWAEFRIFNEEMTPYIQQVKDALEELRSRENSHINVINYYYDQSPETASGYFGGEIWKNGKNYLRRTIMVDYTDERCATWGEMLLGKKAYKINRWNGEDILSGAAEWEYDELLSKELNQFDTWNFYFSMNESQIGEIWVEDNNIVVLTSYEPDYGSLVYKEYTYRFDDAGKLIGGEINFLPEPWCETSEKRLSYTLTVYDISAEEAARVMAAQNVGQPTPFSWEEERQQNLSSTNTIKTQGFSNTTAQPIESGYDAFMRAFNDYEVVAGTHHASHVSYDAQADMWRVEFWWRNGDVNAIIYLDGDGITHMTVMKPYTE